MNRAEIKEAVFCRNCDFEHLSIQDTIYGLMVSDNFCKELNENTGLNALSNEIKEYRSCIYKELIHKLKKLNTIYVAYSKVTNLPYIENKDDSSKIWVFSEKKIALDCVSYFSKYEINIYLESYNQQKFLDFLKECKEYELDGILLDNGVNYITLPIVDWHYEEIDKNSKKIYFASHFLKYFYEFMQESASPFIKPERLQQKRLQMLYSLKSCEFLIPIRNDKKLQGNILKDTLLSFVFVNSSDNKTIWPVFTDWKEFRKWDTKKEFDGYILNYSHLKNLYKKILESMNEVPQMILIPKGFHFPFSLELFETIDNIKIEKGNKK